MNFVRYTLTTDDCVRLRMPPDLIFPSDAEAEDWLAAHKAQASWHGYVTLMVRT